MGKNKKSSGQKDLKQRNAQLIAEVNMLRQQVEVLTSQLAEIQRMIFGRKSEKVSSDQLAMFAGDTAEASPPVEEEEDNTSDIADPPPEPAPNAPLPPREAIPGYRAAITARSHGADYATKSGYADMDFPDVVAPLPDEPVVHQTAQFDRTLRERGIVNLIYVGFATDMCILNAPGGMGPLFGLGYRVVLVRDATLEGAKAKAEAMEPELVEWLGAGLYTNKQLEFELRAKGRLR